MDFISIDISPEEKQQSFMQKLLEEHKKELQLNVSDRATISECANSNFRHSILSLSSSKNYIDEVLKKSIINDKDFHNLHSIGTFKTKADKKKLKLEHKELKKRSLWLNYKPNEITDELDNDLVMLKLRSEASDYGMRYKEGTLNHLSKWVQLGTIKDQPLDYYNRLTQKQRKQTITEEYLSDGDFMKRLKKRYQNVRKQQEKSDYKIWKEQRKQKNKEFKRNMQKMKKTKT